LGLKLTQSLSRIAHDRQIADGFVWRFVRVKLPDLHFVVAVGGLPEQVRTGTVGSWLKANRCRLTILKKIKNFQVRLGQQNSAGLFIVLVHRFWLLAVSQNWLQVRESNTLSSGYGPDDLPFVLPAM